jgi:hypothetical protein
MTYNAIDAFYDDTYTATGNKVTVIGRFNSATFSGGAFRTLHLNPIAGTRFHSVLYPNDIFAGVNGRFLITTRDSAGVKLCEFMTAATLDDGLDHMYFYSFDADLGTAIFYVDGVDAISTGEIFYTAPTTGTLYTGANSVRVGALGGSSDYWGGDIGYTLITDAYLTNPLDFMTGNMPKDIDTSGWTELGGTPPVYFSDTGEMVINDGSGGNMNSNGTITGPS